MNIAGCLVYNAASHRPFLILSTRATSQPEDF